MLSIIHRKNLISERLSLCYVVTTMCYLVPLPRNANPPYAMLLINAEGIIDHQKKDTMSLKEGVYRTTWYERSPALYECSGI